MTLPSPTAPAPIDAIQSEIVAEFSLFDDWQERYRYVIELGRALPPYPDAYRTADYLVRGCQSQVWLHPHATNGVLAFDGASDAAIVSGLVALVLRIYSGQTPATILATKPTCLAEIGLHAHLSMNRSNGLQAMVNTIKSTAQHYITELS